MEINSKQLTPFCFGDNLVRVMKNDNGEPWFVAKDVCKVLELEKNVSQAIANLDDDEKQFINPNIFTADVGMDARFKASGINACTVIPEAGRGGRPMAFISESGLYALVFRSRKPEAKAFSKWVRSEVLPALRKTGRYEMSKSKKRSALPADLPDEARRIPPRMRQKIWQDAIQTARLDGGGSEEARQWFTWLCRLNGYGRSNNSNSLIVDFMDECLVEEKGARSQSSKIYEAFKNWWKLYGEEGWMPSPKTLAQFLGLRFASMKSGVIIYRDCRIRSHAV